MKEEDKTADKQNAGKRLATALLDDLSRRDPDRRFALIPNGQEVSDGFYEFTIGELARAVNYTSWWIKKTLGPISKPETVSYMAANDIRYAVFIFACNKTGYTPLLPSTRNSDDAFLHLLKATDCKKFVCDAKHKNQVLELQKHRPDLQLIDIPSLSEMVSEDGPAYPYETTYKEQEAKVSFIIHSSGTTGLPKPVFLTHGFLGVFDQCAWMPLPPGRQNSNWISLKSNRLLLSTTPFFHIMGYLVMMEALLHECPFVTPPDKPLSPDMLTDVMEATNPGAALLPPSVLEQMSHSDRAMSAISRLQQLHFGGAPLAPEIGNKVNKVTKVLPVIGSSEAGYLASLQPLDRDDWEYYEWNPYAGLEMRFVGDNLYELVITRMPDRDFQGIFHTFPDLQEYHTKDLFIPHSTKPNKWQYYGRLDDVIVLSNGEKFNPVTMEKIIDGHPLVHLAVVVGRGRFQSALLVEPNWNKWSEDRPESEFVDAIWPVVQQANDVTPAYGRLLKSNIGLASKNKPFKTTPKGSSQRHHICKDYEAEIDAIYQKSDADEDLVVPLPEKADFAAIKDYLENVVSSILGRTLTETEDLYGAGLDSLQTVQLTRILQGAISAQLPDKGSDAITTQHIYLNPTIEQLAHIVHRVVSGEVNGYTNGVSRTEKIESLVTKYTEDLPDRKLDVQSVSGTRSIILTGSTGSLGSYILEALLRDPTTAKVYCLNRSADGASRQVKSFVEKGLRWDTERAAKVEFLQASFGAEKFGLHDDKYEEILGSVDTIIHNAWKVDFNHSVSSFEDVHIRGVRRFVDFSLQSVHHAHLHFVSSVATIGAWKIVHGPAVPEEPVENPDVTLPQGYGESKHVAERICLAASRRAGIPTTVLRVGQVGGPTLEKGVWNRQEWLPTMIATSKATGRIPSSLGSAPVDWIPVDNLATIILELVAARRQSQSERRCTAFNLINPSAAPWASLIPAIQKHYPVETVDLATWIHDLEQIKNPSEAEVIAKPGLKLLDFYRGLIIGGEETLAPPVELQQTKEASVMMRTLGPVDQALMENWLTQWAF